MLLAHLTVAGIAEFAVTFGVIAYLQRANIPILRINHPNVHVDGVVSDRRPLGWRWAAVAFCGLVLLTPLGLLAPGGAFGEDTPANLDLGKYNLRAVPTGLARWSSFWDHAVLSRYGFDSGAHPNIGYMLSAVIGLVVISLGVCAVLVASRCISRMRNDDDSARTASVAP